ncbi:carbon-nitrogen hydrolase family protein [uncultured Gemmiger sp.]|uniref:carbon-nitrogen hydrolase family protein n=1 Tax=uncultured Gemmiger sp. TaxID=1623490 RepID=UPI0025E17FEA|nr:carbon-nitrogen hydrolase family protein [uncultured Gemmiger sp.]
MSHFRVALLQLHPGNTREETQKIGLDACHRAKSLGADLALFPEMWSTGYTIPQEEALLRASALPVGHPFLGAFAACARELEMAIGVTCLEQADPRPKNSLFVYDRHGDLVLQYAKVHTCDFGEEACLGRGEEFRAADLDTAAGTVRIGAMICYDREFPESARVLMLQGAEIVLVPNACPMELNRLAQLRARAYENMMGLATCNYPAGHPDCNGHSSAFDGVAYLPGLSGSRDTCILEAEEKPGIFVADFDMEMLRDYRRREVHGNAYRRPECYHLLLEEKIEPPFVRPDRRP